MDGCLVVLPLQRQPMSARDYIEGSGLSDEEVAERLAGEVTIPVRPGLVSLWRRGIGPDPCPSILEFLAHLSPPPAAPALAHVS